jgi:hypothetical protein
VVVIATARRCMSHVIYRMGTATPGGVDMNEAGFDVGVEI